MQTPYKQCNDWEVSIYIILMHLYITSQIPEWAEEGLKQTESQKL